MVSAPARGVIDVCGPSIDTTGIATKLRPMWTVTSMAFGLLVADQPTEIILWRLIGRNEGFLPAKTPTVDSNQPFSFSQVGSKRRSNIYVPA